ISQALMIATLRIQVLFHWASDPARQLATRLYRTFSVRPMGDGPRIPVRYGPRQADGGPPSIDLDAEHEIIVILVDERMARRGRAIGSSRTHGDSWSAISLASTRRQAQARTGCCRSRSTRQRCSSRLP